MTMTIYLLIGLVVYAIVQVETFIRSGLEYFKNTYRPIWNIFTDVVIGVLVWPFTVTCYGVGMTIGISNKLAKKES